MLGFSNQVTIKHLKGGREVRMDLMVMENLFFGRNISRVYDLKGSLRSRYNANATGGNKVMLDLNLLESLRTEPIFLGSKAKRSLERAIWNDTSFLAVSLLHELQSLVDRGFLNFLHFSSAKFHKIPSFFSKL